MKKRYTKKQIAEAIAYWERQLAEGNYRKADGEEAFIEVKDRVTSDPALLGKFEAAYRALDPGWGGDMNDDDYLDWEYDFLSHAAERAEQAGGDVDWASADMGQALDRIIQTGRDDYVR